jgi:hypothetical protein
MSAVRVVFIALEVVMLAVILWLLVRQLRETFR